MVAKVFPRYAPLDPLPEADMDDRATWLEYVIPGAAGEIIVGAGVGTVPTRSQWNQLALPLAGGTVAGVTTIHVGSANAFLVESNLTVRTLVVDTTNKEIEGRNGAKFRGFSDDGTTETFNISGGSGNAAFTGVVSWASANGSATSTQAFVLYRATQENLVMDTTNRELQLWNGTKLRGFSDALVTEKFSIDSATGNAQFDGSVTCSAVATKTTTYTATASDQILLCDATSAGFTVTLPAVASTAVGSVYVIKKIDATNNIVTVDANASETIDGLLTYQLLSRYSELQIINSGSAWSVVDSTIGSSTVLSTTVLDATTTSTALTANTAYLMKMQVFAPITITKMTVIVGTPSGNIDVGVYRQTGTTYTRIVSSGTTALTASSAAQTMTVAATTLYPGFDYCFAVAVDNATTTIGRAAVSGPTSFAGGRIRAFTTSFVLPTSLTIASGVQSGFAPMIVGEP